MQISKGHEISLAGKEMLLCKRKNFNIIQNYEAQYLHHGSLGHGYPLPLGEASLSD